LAGAASSAPARRYGTLAERAAPPPSDAASAHAEAALDAWLAELGIEVVDGSGKVGDAALTRDVVIDGERRFDLRVTVAWVEGVGLSLWAYYGHEDMEIPRRVLHAMLRANFDQPMVKFAMTEDDRPMLMTELPPAAASRDELGRALARLAIVADHLLEETAAAVADRAQLPDWAGRTPRYPQLLATYGADVQSVMPAWAPPPPPRPRRGFLSRLFGGRR
jgi:hypothetical protein